MSKLSKEELLDEFKQMEIDEEEVYKGSLEVPGVNTKLMNQIHQKRKQAYQQIKELIKKPEVTEEWIKKKIDELWIEYEKGELDCEDFIRSLVEEIVHVS